MKRQRYRIKLVAMVLFLCFLNILFRSRRGEGFFRNINLRDFMLFNILIRIFKAQLVVHFFNLS